MAYETKRLGFPHAGMMVKSLVVGSGNDGAATGTFRDDDRHVQENMLCIPVYAVGSLPTVSSDQLNTLGVDCQSGSCTLLVKNPVDGFWYRFNGTKIP